MRGQAAVPRCACDLRTRRSSGGEERTGPLRALPACALLPCTHVLLIRQPSQALLALPSSQQQHAHASRVVSVAAVTSVRRYKSPSTPGSVLKRLATR